MLEPHHAHRKAKATLKKGNSNSKAVIVFIVLMVIFFVSQINFSLLSGWTPPHESTPPGIQHTEFNKGFQIPPLSPGPQTRNISCDRSHRFYDLCTINGPSTLDPTISTLCLVDPTGSDPLQHTVEKIRPYPRKWERATMTRIQEFTLTSQIESPSCVAQHNAPALVFSAGGYTGNFFHDFNDGFIPLYITVNSIFPNSQDFILVISKARDWWISKYADLLQTLSKHPIINLDNDNSTHCFPSATLGLVSHGFMTIDPTLAPNSRTFTQFRAFLGIAFGHGQNHPFKFNLPESRPRLLLMSRSGAVGRVILNQNEVKQLAQEVGFDVIIFEPTPRTPLREAYALINSSHAMVGVHGAALTHSLFLQPGRVLVQVVPLGAEWVAKLCFASSARALGLEYMEYKIGAEESSLADKFGKSSLLIKDPAAVQGKNWSSSIMDIYLKEQNVRIDVTKFRDYLKKAYRKAKKLLDKEGRGAY